jgi:hypothetical protein
MPDTILPTKHQNYFPPQQQKHTFPQLKPHFGRIKKANNRCSKQNFLCLLASAEKRE